MMSRYNKNIFSVGIIFTFIVVCLYLYNSIEYKAGSPGSVLDESSITNLKIKVGVLQNLLNNNRDELAALKLRIMDTKEERIEQWDKKGEENDDVKYVKSVNDVQVLDNKVEERENHDVVDDEQRRVVPKPNKLAGNKVAVVRDVLSKITTPSLSSVCQLRQNYTMSPSDVQMLDLYDLLSFDNPDGGAWKQGWDVNYDKDRVREERTLEVIVVPHSHCDPGWLRTFEQYYGDKTRYILDGMLRHVGDDEKDMRFIYAEISFFELWWKNQSESNRLKVKQLLNSGKLEIVTGGWVMTDEANSHYFSIITELFEGHEWISNHIGDYRPTSHWSIDPFGLSPSIPFLLSAANITNAAIQRVHYSVKKHLAKNKQLEFMWRQLWGAHGKSDMRTHLFPFYSYDIPHTCGPDPKICCQFDFKRLPSGGANCPWNIQPVKITAENVHSRAFILYDQYRKKSELYKTNVLLVPLGDDFRYDEEFEWVEQYENYKQLFDEMNRNEEWNVNARFGTLADYFTELDRSLRVEEQSLPILSGDFFTYSDRDDHYWSGYFTSRPFYKQMDRILQHHLRAAEISFSLSSMMGKKATNTVFSKLVLARRALSLFQHHDGVTGTARDHVVIDYGTKMLAALYATEDVLTESLAALIGVGELAANDMVLDEYRKEHDALPIRRTYTIGDFVVVFNTLSRSRHEHTCIHVDSLYAYLKNDNNKEIQQQISPMFELRENKMVPSDKYELCFLDNLKPFGINIYEVSDSLNSFRTIPVAISATTPVNIKGFKFAPIVNNTFTLSNSLLTATFDARSGFIKSVTPVGHKQIDINLKYVHYGVRGHKKIHSDGDNLSGAYLFLPDGEAKEIASVDHDIVVVDGPVLKKVLVAASPDLKILQVYSLSQNSPSLEITNEVDIRTKLNFELAMRITTNIESGENLYTDLNGIQFILRRRMLNKLPLQAHFYPMPASAYIEDVSSRLSLLGSQALGVASLKSGELEVMLDRRLEQDDGRGLSQPVLDNHRTLSRFRLLVEPLKSDKETGKEKVGFYSLVGLAQTMEVHYPIVRMISKDKPTNMMDSGLPSSLPCDVHIVNLRTMASPTRYESDGSASPRNEAALILYRPFTDCRSTLRLQSDCKEQRNSVG
ncbi:glycosyl hydrolase family 38 protein [Dictyocaulus viviparus]|uniref:Alpha-mannosidase n=1 Tax=Dictyocaulus viviparus TaxID=29172 RepID=A0A0D8XH54_DICVI|nr:glycosyl hydrolase family 38 protein [Dictyocaulus viviparus]